MQADSADNETRRGTTVMHSAAAVENAAIEWGLAEM